MIVFDLLLSVLNAQSCTDGSGCPASAFNAIAAAFSTEGYYAQADLLEYLTGTGLSKLATLIYLLAGGGAIIAYVLGAPPRNYLWFFIGPAVYYWLVDNPVKVNGVRWMTANENPTQQEQAEVWRLAEPGLRNSNYLKRHGGADQVSKNAPPPQADVALPFVWLDDLSSDLVRNFVEMTGVYDLEGGGGGDSNIDAAPAGGTRHNWGILTDLKWGKIEDITAAKLRNGDTRDAFVTFLASECGDAFASQVDESLWIAAASGNGKNIPETVFRFPGMYGGNGNIVGAHLLAEALSKNAIPVPESFTSLVNNGLKENNDRSFIRSAEYLKTKLPQYLEKYDGIPCDAYLWIILHAFRYEAGNIYYHMFSNGPGEFKGEQGRDQVIYSLLYGWGLDADKDKREDFIKNLIFVYLLRNEFAIAPQPADPTFSSSKESKNYVDAFARTVGSKTKFGEVYSWALMMPYIQGVSFYFLAMAYPFAALMVIVPGWHKTIFTWATFWIWLKMWDLGFAVVKVVERSVWAMLSNNSNAQAVNDRVLELADYGKIEVTCAGTNCVIPTISFDGSVEGLATPDMTFQLYGKALALAANLDLDLTNSYYIYIMSALYFAVPAVTGPIVLGAKAGVSSLVGGFISGFSDKVSQGASSGYTGEQAMRIKTNVAGVEQGAYAKAMRDTNGGQQASLGVSALKQGNMGAEAQLDGGFLGTMSGLASGVGAAVERKAGSFQSAVGPVASFLGAQTQETTNASTGASRGSSTGAGGSTNPLAPIGKKGMGPGIEFARNQMSQGSIAYQQQVGEGNADRQVGQFTAQSEQGRANLHGQRVEGQAQFAAQGAAWKAKRNFGNQIAGGATIGGLFAGAMDPGSKPTAGSSAALSGILDSYSSQPGSGGSMGAVSKSQNGDASGAAMYSAQGGGYDQRRGAHEASLKPFASGGVKAAFSPTEPIGALASAGTFTATRGFGGFTPPIGNQPSAGQGWGAVPANVADDIASRNFQGAASNLGASLQSAASGVKDTWNKEPGAINASKAPTTPGKSSQ